ncbi:hypothetical protein EF294_03000 [Gordonia oryzae]|uniref:Uncharacterized protein n=1 Tax=Gordonia oryzae TaxID=2487349 RepID=A0A3N4GTS0_9ACTN|nr:hypothetical protein EF294_03000 [Gordonia oryzae]
MGWTLPAHETHGEGDTAHRCAQEQGSSDPKSVGEQSIRARDAARRRRDLDAIFGDSLPETTRDERDLRHIDEGRARYDRERPPHYE